MIIPGKIIQRIKLYNSNYSLSHSVTYLLNMLSEYYFNTKKKSRIYKKKSSRNLFVSLFRGNLLLHIKNNKLLIKKQQVHFVKWKKQKCSARNVDGH